MIIKLMPDEYGLSAHDPSRGCSQAKAVVPTSGVCSAHYSARSCPPAASLVGTTAPACGHLNDKPQEGF